MAKNDDYWAQREAVEKQWMAKNLSDDKAYAKHLNGYYDKALTAIQNRINDQYTRFASKSGMTMADAKGAVSAADQAAFSKEAAEVVEKAQKAFSNGKHPGGEVFTASVNEHMRIYNATMRINRLEYLKAQIGMEAVKNGVDVGKDMTNKLSEDYLTEVKRQAALLGDYLPPTWATDYKHAFEIVMNSGNPNGFNDVLWKNTDAMKASLDQALTSALVQGINPKVIARDLRQHLMAGVDNAKMAAERLARTESARVQSTAQDDCYRDIGVTDVRWVAEPSACKLCSSIASDNGGIYKLDDVPALPAHPNCRCSKAPHADRNNLERLVEIANQKNITSSVDMPEANDLHFEKRGQFVKTMKTIGFEKVSSTGLNLETMTNIYTVVENFYHQYPQMRGYIKRLAVINSPTKSVVASAGFNKREWKQGHIFPELTINAAKLPTFQKTLDRCLADHWWTQKSDYTGIVNHELAHLIHHKLALNRNGFVGDETVNLVNAEERARLIKAVNMMNQHVVDRETMEAVFKKAGIPYDQWGIEHNISKYGTTNDAEAFAEAMSNEDKYNKVTQYTHEIVEKELKEIANGPTGTS